MTRRPRQPSHPLSACLTGAALPAAALGTLSYLLLRPTTLRMFDWVHALGLGRPIVALRDGVAPLAASLPRWIGGSVPFALLVFAAVRLSRQSRWVALAPALAIGAELGQGAGLVPGTFDAIDMFALVVATAAGLCGRPTRASRRRLEPAVVGLGFVVLAAGSGRSTVRLPRWT